MQTFIRLMILMFIIFCDMCYARETILIVANIDDKALKLTRQEVRNIFMGGTSPYELTAIALPAENITRVLFNTRVVGLTESRIQSYWAQMKFSGRKRPPKELNSEQLVVSFLEDNQGAVGYLPAHVDIPSDLTVIFEMK